MKKSKKESGMRNIVVFTAVLGLGLLGSTAMADFDSGDATADTTGGTVSIGTTTSNATLTIANANNPGIDAISIGYPAPNVYFTIGRRNYYSGNLVFDATNSGGAGFNFSRGSVSIGKEDISLARVTVLSNEGVVIGPNQDGLAIGWDTTNYYKVGRDLFGGYFEFDGSTELSAGKAFAFTNANVGIGITGPAYDLDVVGDINYTGTLYQNGVPVTFAAPYNDTAIWAAVDELRDIVLDLPPGLLNQKDRNGDGG